jgi:uncharacterized membrane protein
MSDDTSQPMYTPQPQQGGKTPGSVVAAFILSLLGFICLIPAIIGLILGITGRKKAKAAGSGSGLAIAAIVISIIWIVIAVITGIVFAAAGGSSSSLSNTDVSVDSGSNDSGLSDSGSTDSGNSDHTVTYKVNASGGGISNVTYLTVADGQSGMQQATDVGKSFSKTLSLPSSLFDFQIFSLSGQGDENTNSISCTITVDGKVIADQTSTGAFSVVMCSGSN